MYNLKNIQILFLSPPISYKLTNFDKWLLYK